MSQVFKEDGTVIPVTLVKVEPCYVTQIKTEEKDGYNAIQIGSEITAKKIKSPQKGHLKDLPSLKYLREFRIPKEGVENFKRGDKIDISIFSVGDKVDVTGYSKGRGFAGVVKRHGFKGSPASHGHKDQLRMPGSIGSKRQGPIPKGKRMAGRMGGNRVTIKNLEIVQCDEKNNILALKGAIPGARNSKVLIRKY
jgi:large subunit ribosomal protein L3